MTVSPTITKLAAALIKARGEFTPIKRTKEVTITGQRTYSFKYAPLEEIQAATDPALRANGLCVIQDIGAEGISTMILHESGEFIDTQTIALNPNLYGAQLGAEITYKRRYQLAGALSVAIEDDSDAPETNALNQPDGKITLTTKHTPLGGVLASLPTPEQESLRKRADSIEEAFRMRNPLGAFEAYNECPQDAHTRAALWSLLGSKVRSALTKMNNAQKETVHG